MVFRLFLLLWFYTISGLSLFIFILIIIGSFQDTADQAKSLLQFTDYQLKTIVDAIESSSKASNSLNKELSYVICFKYKSKQ